MRASHPSSRSRPADPELGYARTVHAADHGRIAAIVARAKAWIALRRTAAADKRLAMVLSAYPGRDDQMAHAVGLDAPESTIQALHDLRDQGYSICGCCPRTVRR